MEGQPFLPIEVDSSSDEEDVTIPDENEEINWGEAQVLADVSHIEGHIYENEFTKKETIATIDADGNINEKQLTEVHNAFKAFCKDQYFSGVQGWDPTKPLPWRVDPLLVNKVKNEFKISKRQAACWWLQLRRAHGNLQSTKVQGNAVEEYEQTFCTYCNDNIFSAIRSEVISEWSEKLQYSLANDSEMKKLFNAVFQVESMKEGLSLLLKDRMNQYNVLLSRNLVGMTPENQANRLGKFMKGWQSSIKKKFLPDCLKEFRMSESQKTRHLFITLENELYKTWNTSMNRYLLPEVVCVISETEIENVVLQSGGLLYYIAGWLLYRLNKSTARVAPLAKRFAAHNTIAADSTSASITGVIDSREKHKGKLTRVSVEFFDYITLLEAIYKVNLDDPRKVWAYKDKLFPELLQLTTRSAQVDKYFGRCVPYDFSTDDKRDVLSYTLKIFCSMRAGDYIKSLRKKATDANNGMIDNLQLRSAIVAAHLIASGQQPAAISGP